MNHESVRAKRFRDPGLDQVRAQVASCGGWLVTVRESGVAVQGSGSRIDGLRALCVAWWQALDHSVVFGDNSVAEALSEVGW